jgi:hypothetical protein
MLNQPKGTSVEIAKEDITAYEGRGKKAKYPWDEWIKLCIEGDKTLEAFRGVDFTVIPSHFVPTLHYAAKSRGLRVTASPKENSVVFKFFKQDEDTTATE